MCSLMLNKYKSHPTVMATLKKDDREKKKKKRRKRERVRKRTEILSVNYFMIKS